MSIPEVIQEARERALQQAVQWSYNDLLRGLVASSDQKELVKNYQAAVDLACLAYNLTKG